MNPQNIIIKYLGINGIEYLDLLPLFKETNLEAEKLFMDNAHPTTLGHEIIANEISKVIIDSEINKIIN